jgi:hypothetical protein
MSVATALSRPPFRFLLVGQVVSIAGDRFNYLALVALLSTHAAAHGHDPATALAVFAWAMMGPSLFVSPWAGAFVDRRPLVRTLLATDLARAFVVAAIPLAYAATGALAPVYALVALAFTLNAFFLPARSAIPPRLVPPEALAAGNAILVLGGVVATVVGTSLGGPLVDRFGPAAALYIDAATYGVSVLALAGLLRAGVDGSSRGAAAAPGEATPADARAPWRRAAADVAAGWRVALGTPRARGPLVAAIATWVAGGVLHVAGTAHVQRGSTAVTGLGLLLGALAVGAVLGTALTLRGERHRAPGHVPARGGALATGLIGAGAGLVGFAFAPTLPLMAASGFVCGLFAAPVFFLSETALQEAVPEDHRARVFAARDALARAAFLATAALAAPLVHAFGTAATLGAGAALLISLGVVARVEGAARGGRSE